MHFIVAASFVAVFIATAANIEATGTNTSCTMPFNKIMLCNLMCNLLEDSQTNAAMKTIQTKLENLIAVVNKSPAGVPVSSCKEQYEKYSSTRSQMYPLMFGSLKIPVYCHMGNFGCGNGGWTLAMKIDGRKKTFHYDSAFWSNKNAYNLAGGQTGFDFQETKLPTYWSTGFSKICLGMKIPGQPIKFLLVNKQAQSLHALIANGKYNATSLGLNKWKKLIGPQASLQVNCKREGFNAAAGRSGYAKIRIGIIGNDQKDCLTTDSRIGFGGGGQGDDSNTCGNDAINHPSSDNGPRKIKAMGYILVQ
ncbi:PREDICTED: uncharacterized skeletal organic matrix protein 5-like [Acropora digitifera]|uniref:uncharacterized skeletal organic matrix protein 5-like n=1 Tax=Acropora digitifera TaxID=70779 RepID=UPI00077AF446|nr:PREDICTED: uncharacterized skeletal organic matrix protein 5-like [Acropora digitifera]